MSNFSKVRINDTIKHLAATYLQRESNRTSLITVTNVDLYDHESKATILITVLPENKEKTVLDFAKRHRAEFREFIKENARLRIIPFIDFDIDRGEKNRQRVDELTINEKTPTIERSESDSDESTESPAESVQ